MFNGYSKRHTALHLIAKGRLYHGPSNKKPDEVNIGKYLLSQGLDVNAVDQ